MKISRDNFLKVVLDVDMIIEREDILMACKSEEARNKLRNHLYKNSGPDYLNVFDRHFDDIDIDVLMLIALKNAMEDLKRCKDPKKIEDKKNKIKKLKGYLKGKKIFRVFEQLDNKNNKVKLEIYDTDILLEGKDKKGKERVKSFEQFTDELEKIHVATINNRNISGCDSFFGVIPQEELLNVFTKEELKDVAKFYSYNKVILNDLKRTSGELLNIRTNNYEEIIKIIKEQPQILNYVYNSILATIEELSDYVDFNKIIMLGAYRIEDALNTDAKDESVDAIKQILEKIVENFNEKDIDKKHSKRKANIKYDLNVINDNDEWEQITYSVEDIEKCLERFRNGKYYSKQDLQEKRELIKNNELQLNELVDEDIVDITLTKNDLENLLFSNNENYKFIKEKLQLSNEQIMELAEQQGLDSSNKLDLLIEDNIMSTKKLENLFIENNITQKTLEEVIAEQKNIDLINFKKLIEMYDEIKLGEQNKNKYSRYLEFCKVIKKQEAERSEDNNSALDISEELMENLAENYDTNKRDEYLKKLEHFYYEGLLDIRSIISWEDEGIINNFYNDGVIDLNTFKSGIIPENAIINAYVNDIISRDEIDELIDLGIVDKNNDKVKEKNHQGFAKRVEDAFGFSPDAVKFNENAKRLSKNKNQLGPNIVPFSNTRTVMKDNKPVVIIDPDFREEYIRLFGAVDIELPVDENNSFYNYKSYVLPDEHGELGENSVVIAERYFEDKDTKRVFATDNATYFFRFEDLVDKMSKKSVRSSESKKSFIAYHILGKWGKNVIRAVAQTMLGNDLKSYSKKEADKMMLNKLQEVYTVDELADILEMAGEIDRGDFDCEIYEEDVR